MKSLWKELGSNERWLRTLVLKLACLTTIFALDWGKGNIDSSEQWYVWVIKLCRSQEQNTMLPYSRNRNCKRYAVAIQQRFSFNTAWRCLKQLNLQSAYQHSLPRMFFYFIIACRYFQYKQHFAFQALFWASSQLQEDSVHGYLPLYWEAIGGEFSSQIYSLLTVTGAFVNAAFQYCLPCIHKCIFDGC